MHFGNTLIVKGELTTGAFASFITSLLLLYKPTKELGNTLTNLQSIFVSMSRVFELFDLMPEIKDKENRKLLEQADKKLASQTVLRKLFVIIGKQYSEKKGGYTRIYHLPPRRGDATEMALIQLV